MVKFITLLKSIKEFDGELITEEYETNYGFVWDREMTDFTPAGKKKFSKILNSNAEIIRNGVIMLKNKKITYEELELFTGTLAGYVSASLYHKWIIEKDD
jgi:hypothetical protein